MSVYIFLGPTLSDIEARQELDAVYLPPAAQGDVYRLAACRPDVIGIVDGYFQSVPSVWHKEVLWAMCQGAHVYGSASIGALRAAELSAFGMVGVGAVFEAFRDGVFEDDDEVAIHHAPSELGFRPLSDAMINIRWTIRAAADANIIDASTGNALVDLAKARYYPERSYQNLLRDAHAAGLPRAQLEALRRWLPGGRIDRKRLDALEMLRRIRLDLASGLEAKVVRYHFEYTYHWDRCWRTAEASNRSGPTSPTLLQDVLEELCLIEHGWQRARTGALMRLLAIRESQRQAVEVAPEHVESLADAYRLARGLHTPALLKQWLQENGMPQDEFLRLLEDEARIDRVEQLFRPEVLTMLADHLRSTGEYASLLARAHDKRRVLDAGGLDRSQAGTAEITDAELLGWYFRESLGTSMPSDLDLRSKIQGFADARQLREAVLREWFYVRAKRPVSRGEPRNADLDYLAESALAAGDPAPSFDLPSVHSGPISLGRLSGKPTLLVFPRSGLQPQDLLALNVFGEKNDVQVLCILASPSGIEWPASSHLIPLFDPDLVVHRRYGMADPGAVLLDAAHRIVSIFPLRALPDLPLYVRPLLDSLSEQESHTHAPVLIVPNALSRELCAELIACWRESDTVPFTDRFGETPDAHRIVTHRVDHWLRPGRLASAVSTSIARRVVPEMRRAFHFQPDAVEQYRIGCYAPSRMQGFRPHRDNTSAETADRRYSLSISLNTEEYTGGYLRFPEYGPREYRLSSGGALVFSSSLVHFVTSVISGERFALISHFLDSDVGVRRTKHEAD